MRARILTTLLALAAFPFASPASSNVPADAQVIVAAERAFARDGEAHGWAWAFRRHHAPDAQMLSPDPTDAASVLARVQGDGENKLDWRPAYAGIARSGDLGFTTGPFLFRGGDGKVVGHYFTVWRRQDDGSWKWIFDGGTDVVDPKPVPVDFAVPTLPLAASGAASGEEAIADVNKNEALLRQGGPDLSRRHAALLAENVRVNRAGATSAIGKAEAVKLLALDGPIHYVPFRRDASSAGDLVFTLGEVRGPDDSAAPLAHYARIWQRQSAGWRIVFDETIPRRVKR